MNSSLASLRLLIKKQNLEAILISSVPNIIYFTGFPGFSSEERDAYLFITEDSAYIFTHGIYKEAVKKSVPDFKLIDISRENPIGKSLKDVIKKHSIKKFGFEDTDLHFYEYSRIIEFVQKDILTPVKNLTTLRIKKSQTEIASIQAACSIGDRAFNFILGEIALNIHEKELAAKLEYFIKSSGGEIAFPTIIAFGENAAYPHHVPTLNKLKRNQFVLMDFGVKIDNYCSDMTRTVSFQKATQSMNKVYKTVFESQQKAIDFIVNKLAKKEVIHFADVDQVSREYILKKGYPNMIHSLGHGIGLEVHESPRLSPVSNDTLTNGMVFSIEPGIYLPGEMGVRIEDLFTVKNNNLVQLTNSPRKFMEV